MKDPQKRLGFKRGATEIKQHSFFETVNWALIRTTHPPEIPKPVDLLSLNLAFNSSLPPTSNRATVNSLCLCKVYSHFNHTLLLWQLTIKLRLHVVAQDENDA
ncbi:hypothetical protein OIU77_002020 [Salix suchowensis]|uniref:non-specific serine/threonine protein kinase n=1 Tax=Salix suchowensis TaxID=1278906 RepID=A0ABQ9B5L1_9ROSI|nr:hypothetical protein OIU77_002020 [Salix suchowensis]